MAAKKMTDEEKRRLRLQEEARKRFEDTQARNILNEQYRPPAAVPQRPHLPQLPTGLGELAATEAMNIVPKVAGATAAALKEVPGVIKEGMSSGVRSLQDASLPLMQQAYDGTINAYDKTREAYNKTREAVDPIMLDAYEVAAPVAKAYSDKASQFGRKAYGAVRNTYKDLTRAPDALSENEIQLQARQQIEDQQTRARAANAKRLANIAAQEKVRQAAINQVKQASPTGSLGTEAMVPALPARQFETRALQNKSFNFRPVATDPYAADIPVHITDNPQAAMDARGTAGSSADNKAKGAQLVTDIDKVDPRQQALDAFMQRQKDYWERQSDPRTMAEANERMLRQRASMERYHGKGRGSAREQLAILERDRRLAAEASAPRPPTAAELDAQTKMAEWRFKADEGKLDRGQALTLNEMSHKNAMALQQETNKGLIEKAKAEGVGNLQIKKMEAEFAERARRDTQNFNAVKLDADRATAQGETDLGQAILATGADLSNILADADPNSRRIAGLLSDLKAPQRFRDVTNVAAQIRVMAKTNGKTITGREAILQALDALGLEV